MSTLCAISATSTPGFQSGDGGYTPTIALHLDKHAYVVRPCALALGQEMVRRLHYAKGGSNTAVYMHGLFEKVSQRLVGVAWWLPPTRVAAESVNRAEWKRVLSLTRFVIEPGQPTNAASFLLGKSVLLIRRDARFVSLVTYADESQGHTGAIYAAASWQYVGRTGPYWRWTDAKTGQQVARKSTVTRTDSSMRALGYVRTGPFFKHKFIRHLS